jgi:hypothetical protein
VGRGGGDGKWKPFKTGRPMSYLGLVNYYENPRTDDLSRVTEITNPFHIALNPALIFHSFFGEFLMFNTRNI